MKKTFLPSKPKDSAAFEALKATFKGCEEAAKHIHPPCHRKYAA